ncbi:putative mediator of RNA polymerase II transcription subunit 26 [Drosophila gunungcola]|uniref:Uncharacterized protein n=1 Tax=Drosophila gunungcola TaxID=103775 RepID=A0A9P9YQI4_9MUSC|nr:putative mediator of RNA polymerase II transcription subunit 26 [Drosophila gunungcola]KAI8041304.1 hypothetical protein M5D96_005561 [Drosophila gunungcola]
MPNGGVRTHRASPYRRNVSPARRTTNLGTDLSPEPTNNRIEQQLLRTLVQSLPAGAETKRSRSSCPPTYRRRRQASSCRSMGTPELLTTKIKTKPPVRLQAGMPVTQVLASVPPSSKTSGLSKNAQQSIEASVKRRAESPTARAKARDEEFEKTPEMLSGAAIAKAREEEFEKIPSKTSKISGASQDESIINSKPETQENSGPETQENSIPETQENSRPETQKNSIAETQENSIAETQENSRPETQENSKPETQENSRRETEKNSKENSQDTFNKSFPESVEASKPEEPREPKPAEQIEVTKRPAKKPEKQKPTQVASSKKYPCFRGEYPTRHRPVSYQWFQAAVPNCGNIVTICDEEQQVMGEAEIVTACEVTEAHFLSIDCPDDHMNNAVSKCNKCPWESYGYLQHQRNGNCFGSQQKSQHQLCFQQQPCFQQQQSPQQLPYSQQQPCFQQQQPCFQQQPCLQQQSSCFQQQHRNFMRNAPISNEQGNPRRSFKHEEMNQPSNLPVYHQQQSMQQPILQPQQQPEHQEMQQQQQPVEQQPIEENCLTEMLAEELKKQMLEAQAQIAQVQLQLNSACGATRVRQMHVLTQNGAEIPGWTTENQFVGALDDALIEGYAFPEEVKESGEEDFPRFSTQSEPKYPLPSDPQTRSQAEPMQFGLNPVPLTMSNPNTYFQPEFQQFPAQQQQPPTFLPQEMSLCQQNQPMGPGQQNQLISPCQQHYQVSPCQQIPQMPPCQQQCRTPPFPPQKPPPCQQKPQRLSHQQQQQQQQQSARSSQSSQLNKCPFAPQFCPSCCCQRYAQMRFMMPRCWPR